MLKGKNFIAEEVYFNRYHLTKLCFMIFFLFIHLIMKFISTHDTSIRFYFIYGSKINILAFNYFYVLFDISYSIHCKMSISIYIFR